MKHRYLFVSALVAVLLFSACTLEVPVEQTIVRHGRLYTKKAPEPFTGFVTGKGREGYRSEVCTYRKRYRDGLLEGESRFWFPDGQLESIEPYLQGKINGIVTRYDKKGRVMARIHLVNGQRGGEHGEVFWHRNRSGS